MPLFFQHFIWSIWAKTFFYCAPTKATLLSIISGALKMLICVPLSGQNSSRDQELSIFILTRIFKLLSLTSLLALSLITLAKQAYFVGPMEPKIKYSSGGNYIEAVSQVLLYSVWLFYTPIGGKSGQNILQIQSSRSIDGKVLKNCHKSTKVYSNTWSFSIKFMILWWGRILD